MNGGTRAAFATEADPACGFAIGCNYWASHAGVAMWRDWDEVQVARDLDALAAHRLSVLRVFPLWPDFQPLTALFGCNGDFKAWAQADGPLSNPECVDMEMVARFRRLCVLASGRGLRLVVGLLTGWMSGRLFAPPALERLDLVADPAARMWEVRFVRRFVRETRDCTAIAAWDVGNECNCLGKAASRAEAWTWLHEIASAIRLEDPSRPVCGGMHSLGTGADAVWNLRDQGELVDLLATHPYPLWTPGMSRGPFDSLRGCIHPAAQSLLYAGLSGKPCIVEEAGDMGRNVCSEARSAGNVRSALFATWAAGLHAYLRWCAFDQDRLDFPPYVWNALECDLGLFAKDFRAKPALLEMRAFAGFLESLPFRQLPPRRIDAICLVSENEDAEGVSLAAFALAAQAGFSISFAGAEGDIPAARLYVMPSAESYSGYSVSAWRRVLAKVEQGATLLVTRGGRMALAAFEDATGDEIDCAEYDTPSETAFRLASHQEAVLSAKSSSTVRILARRSEVVGATGKGEAAITVHRYGQGNVIYANAPIEREAFSGAGAFAPGAPNPLYLVYDAAARIAGLPRRVEKIAAPDVAVTEHPAGNGREIVVAVNLSPNPVECRANVTGTVGQVWRGRLDDGNICLAANDAAVFELLP